MSSPPYDRSAFLFRRDLRCIDNTGLHRACRESRVVVPLFVFDPAQASDAGNDYFSPNAFQFLIESLRDLASQIADRGGRLFVLEGKPADVLGRLFRTGAVDALYLNRDYTPFARRRDGRIRDAVKREGAAFHLTPDALLTEPEQVRKEDGRPFFVYSRFRRQARSINIPPPRRRLPSDFDPTLPDLDNGTLPTTSLDAYDRYDNPDLAVRGGRTAGEQRLQTLTGFGNYAQERNRLDSYTVTGLSAHLKFGTISPREVYAVVADRYGPRHKLISQLRWRDFYTHFAYHHPSVFGRAVRPKDKYIDWHRGGEAWERWCAGQTGVPLVDAGMRELVTTGYMHNRARMTVASFLTKHLLIDWREGERFFARHLVDYDPSVNNGNWQWSASVGLDRIPLRMFNPYTQAEKFDKAAAYIQEWVSELRDVDPGRLTSGDADDVSDAANYPAPLVDHNSAYHRARQVFEEAQEQANGRYDVPA